MADGFEVCDVCVGQGRIYRANGNDPDERDCGACPECGGDGKMEVKDETTAPVEENSK